MGVVGEEGEVEGEEGGGVCEVAACGELAGCGRNVDEYTYRETLRCRPTAATHLQLLCGKVCPSRA